MIEKGITSIPPDPSSNHIKCPLLNYKIKTKQNKKGERTKSEYLFPMEYLSELPKEIKNHISTMINSAFTRISLS